MTSFSHTHDVYCHILFLSYSSQSPSEEGTTSIPFLLMGNTSHQGIKTTCSGKAEPRHKFCHGMSAPLISTTAPGLSVLRASPRFESHYKRVPLERSRRVFMGILQACAGLKVGPDMPHRRSERGRGGHSRQESTFLAQQTL